MDRKDQTKTDEIGDGSNGQAVRAQLVLGPLLRYAGTKSASFWVETSSPCEVEVLGHRGRTFCVEGLTTRCSSLTTSSRDP